MYLPFKKEFQGAYKFNSIEFETKIDSFLFLLKLIVKLFLKVVLLLILIFSFIAIINVITLAIKINSFDMNFGYVGSSNSEMFFVTFGIVNDVMSIIRDIFIGPSEPITSNTFWEYYIAVAALFVIAITLFGLGFYIPGGSSSLGEIASSVFDLTLYIVNIYFTQVVAVINDTTHLWNLWIIPLAYLTQSLIQIFLILSGLELIKYLVFGNSGTMFGLPIYFWLGFLISVVLMIIIIFNQLLKVSASSRNEQKKQKLSKNIMGGFLMTIAGLIFIPLLFLVFGTLTSILVFKTITLTGNTYNPNTNVAYLIYGSCFKNGASPMIPNSGLGTNFIPLTPWGKLGGLEILLTPTYFNYTLFIVANTAIIICTGILIVFIISKIYSLLQLLIFGPITNAFFIQDGGLAFKVWIKNVSSQFTKLFLVILQVAIFISSIWVVETIFSDLVSTDEVAFISLLVLFYISMTYSVISSWKNIDEIFFKDREVNSRIDSSDLTGLEVESKITNKSLQIDSKTLSRSLQKVSTDLSKTIKKELKVNNKSISKLGKSITSGNNEIKSFNEANAFNVKKMMKVAMQKKEE